MSLAGWTLEEPTYSVFDAVMAERHEAEPAFETAKRVLITEALLFTDGNQVEASKLLGTTPRVMVYYIRKYRLKDRWNNGGRRRQEDANAQDL